MREGWNKRCLGDLINIKHGYAFKGEYFVDYPTDNYLLTPGNFAIGGGFKMDKIKFYEGPIPKEYILKKGDVIVTMTDLSKKADTLGYSAKVPAEEGKLYLHNQRLGLVSLKTNEVDLYFIYWLLRTSRYQKYVANSSTGATVKHTSPKKIYSAKLWIPKSKETQRKIASILSAYDELIENNLKRIKLLEEKAQLTYEEWFVRMKFPCHENTPIKEETGLPEGWEKTTLDYLCEKITDGTHDSPKQAKQGIKLITGKHIDRGFIDFDSAYLISQEDHYKIKKRSEISKGDILFSNIGTLGNVGMVTESFEYSCKNVIIFKYKESYSSFLFCYLSDHHTRMKLDARSSGVAQKFYSLTLIRNYKENFPNHDLICQFDKVVKPLIDLKFQLNYQNQLLKETRDILLPRLMSGMIDVDEINLSAFDSGNADKMSLATETKEQ